MAGPPRRPRPTRKPLRCAGTPAPGPGACAAVQGLRLQGTCCKLGYPPQEGRACSWAGRAFTLALRARPPLSLSLSRHRSSFLFFSGEVTFAFPRLPESWRLEAAPSLGAVPWHRRSLSEPRLLLLGWVCIIPHHTLRRREPAPFGLSFRLGADPLHPPRHLPLLRSPFPPPPLTILAPTSPLRNIFFRSPFSPPPFVVSRFPLFEEGWLIWRAKCPLPPEILGFGICCSGTKDGRTTTGEWCAAV